MDGILLVDKPKGLTSHDVVALIRRRFKIRKVGHAGALDPQATGVLVLLLGKMTKMSNQFSQDDKEYRACLRLGIATDTQDSAGQVTKQVAVANINLSQVEQTFCQFLGPIEQIPPMFSALKFKGKRLYKLARQGIKLQRQARRVYIYEFKITRFKLPNIYFGVSCSKGTYIRTLCVDIAKRLGSIGHLSELQRIRSGPWLISQAVGLEDVRKFSSDQLNRILVNRVSEDEVSQGN